MVPKLFFVIGLTLISLGVVLGAPKTFDKETDLKKAVEDFLLQDKEFLDTLEKATSLADGPTRLRRQTEVDNMAIDTNLNDADEQKEGFFDRAAKFVVDLLQRFLKWINSDSN